MASKRLGVCLAVLTAFVLGPGSGAWAHGVIGQRFFPATLAIDDPFVADELSLPTISFMPFNGSGDSPPFRQTNVSAEFSKRLTPDLGFSLAGNLTILDPDHGKTQSGFDNMEVSLKYVFFKSAEHETLLVGRCLLGRGRDGEQAGRRRVLRHRDPAALLRQGHGRSAGQRWRCSSRSPSPAPSAWPFPRAATTRRTSARNRGSRGTRASRASRVA